MDSSAELCRVVQSNAQQSKVVQFSDEYGAPAYLHHIHVLGLHEGCWQKSRQAVVVERDLGVVAGQAACVRALESVVAQVQRGEGERWGGQRGKENQSTTRKIEMSCLMDYIHDLHKKPTPLSRHPRNQSDPSPCKAVGMVPDSWL